MSITWERYKHGTCTRYIRYNGLPEAAVGRESSTMLTVERAVQVILILVLFLLLVIAIFFL
ncbi:hypothetical protein Q5741_03725 [Paenibacillus sp. JX-17]|uniref:Uncharacterized protein n=1 Tax=Paenibacillus lacisoli TaxID=3064525 RepID=A0ABT9CD52_9BACL|nr:hypothetical protein [Paenibacillus sp. JX-17]MDO7905518.1 hypothetical protein [Paenibacillus sp. JX-17]